MQTLRPRYDNPREYLTALIAKAKASNPELSSLREISRRLGYANPSYLADIIGGRRRLKVDMARKLACILQLNVREAAALVEMAKRQGATSGVDHAAAQQKTTRMVLDRFRFVADWFHLAILETLDLQRAPQNAEEFSRRLGRRISRTTAELAITRLKRLGLITHAAGKLAKTTNDLFVGDEASNEAIRLHHLQMIDLAKDCLQNLPMEQRDIRGTMLAIKRADWPQLLAMVSEFHHELHALHAAGEADLVVRINTQAFSLTQEEQ